MKSYVTVIGAAIFLFSHSGLSMACGCTKPESISNLADYVHVFKGKVISIKREADSDEIRATVTFKVLELMDGPEINKIEVHFRQGGTSCDLESVNFRVNEIYLISTSEYAGPKGQYYIITVV